MLLLLLLEQDVQAREHARARTVRARVRSRDPVCVRVRVAGCVCQQRRLARIRGGALLAQTFEAQDEPTRRRLCASFAQHIKRLHVELGCMFKPESLRRRIQLAAQFARVRRSLFGALR